MIHKFMLILPTCVDMLETLSCVLFALDAPISQLCFSTRKCIHVSVPLGLPGVFVHVCRAGVHFQNLESYGNVRVFHRRTVQAPGHLLPNSVAHSRRLYIAARDHTNMGSYRGAPGGGCDDITCESTNTLNEIKPDI